VATAWVLALLLAGTGCSASAGSGSASPTGEKGIAPLDPSSEAPTPSGTGTIFDVEATLHPGPASGPRVPTKVDVAVTNIGTGPGAMVGTATLTDAGGTDFLAVPGHPEGQVLDFGTLQPGATAVRSYVIDLPTGVEITTVLVEPENGIGVDGPVTTPR
jgi:hypothetical protein